MNVLVSDWKRILKYAWSVRFMLASAIASLAATSWALLGGNIDPVLFAGGSFVLGALAILARIIDQGLSNEKTD
jgi:hypothetical protein